MDHSQTMDMLCPTLAFIDGLGAPEMGLIFVIVLVLFGGQKLPEFARGLGKSIREFKKAAAGVEEEFKRALEEDERKHATPTPALPEATTPPETPATSDPAGPDSGSDYYNHDHSYGTEYTETPAPTAEAAPTTPPAEEKILPPDQPAETPVPVTDSPDSAPAAPAATTPPETAPSHPKPPPGGHPENP